MNVREWALPVYTILMQLALGTLLSLWLTRVFATRRYGRSTIEHITRIPVSAVLLTIIVAIIGSHFHLSRPMLSMLAALNVHSSWLSREIFFTISFLLVTAGLTYLQWLVPGFDRLKTMLGWVSIVFGILSVYCMSKIYLLPTHSSWNSPVTVISFFLTALLLGITTVAVLLVMDLKISEVADDTETSVRRQLIQHTFVRLAWVAWITAVTQLLLNLYVVVQLNQGDISAQTSLMLMLGLYQPLLSMRYITLFTGVGWFGLAAFVLFRQRKVNYEISTPVYLACLLVLIAEILGRFLFYATHVRAGI